MPGFFQTLSVNTFNVCFIFINPASKKKHSLRSLDYSYFPLVDRNKVCPFSIQVCYINFFTKYLVHIYLLKQVVRLKMFIVAQSFVSIRFFQNPSG